VKDGRIWAGRRALRGEVFVFRVGGGRVGDGAEGVRPAGDGKGPPGTIRVMVHDVKVTRLEVYDFGLAGAGGPSATTIVPYSPSGRHFPGRSPS